jgi:hypothetical protein
MYSHDELIDLAVRASTIDERTLRPLRNDSPHGVNPLAVVIGHYSRSACDWTV